jgi:hypothetical protein
MPRVPGSIREVPGSIREYQRVLGSQTILRVQRVPPILTESQSLCIEVSTRRKIHPTIYVNIAIERYNSLLWHILGDYTWTIAALC